MCYHSCYTVQLLSLMSLSPVWLSWFQGKGSPVRRPPMPYHRFTAGDVIAITPGKAPPTQSEVDSGAVLDGVVLQR